MTVQTGDTLYFPFIDLGCDEQPDDESNEPGGPNCGPSGEGFFVELGYQNEESYNPICKVCYDPTTARSIYAYSVLYKEIVARDTSNDRPSFKSDGYYSFDVADAYTRVKSPVN